MAYQNISAVLTQEQVDAIVAAAKVIESNLPFAVVLDEDEKQYLVKTGAKSIDFVEDANRAVKNYPQIIPASINAVEFDKDAVLFAKLSNVRIVIEALARKVVDTHIAVGSEAMYTSLKVYRLVEAQKSVVPGLTAVWEKMRERFRGQMGPKKKKKEKEKEG